MNEGTNSFFVLFIYTLRGWVGDHECGQPAGIFCDIVLKILQVDVPLMVATDSHHFHTSHHGAGRVGAVSRLGEQTDISIRFTAALQVLLDHQQSGLFSLGTRVGLEAHAVEAGDIRQPLLKVAENLLIAFRLRQGDNGV